MRIKKSEKDYNLSERFVPKEKLKEKETLFYFPRIKSFLYLENDENEKIHELFLYDYNFSLLSETKEKYSLLEVVKISDDINNDYYNFVVNSIDRNKISALLFLIK